MNCQECRDSQFPDDPTVHNGPRGYCGCDFCDKPMSQREGKPQPRISVMQSDEPRDYEKAVQQIGYLLTEINYLKNQVNWLKLANAELEKKIGKQDPLPQPAGNWWEKRERL